MFPEIVAKIRQDLRPSGRSVHGPTSAATLNILSTRIAAPLPSSSLDGRCLILAGYSEPVVFHDVAHEMRAVVFGTLFAKAEWADLVDFLS